MLLSVLTQKCPFCFLLPILCFPGFGPWPPAFNCFVNPCPLTSLLVLHRQLQPRAELSLDFHILLSVGYLQTLAAGIIIQPLYHFFFSIFDAPFSLSPPLLTDPSPTKYQILSGLCPLQEPSLPRPSCQVEALILTSSYYMRLSFKGSGCLLGLLLFSCDFSHYKHWHSLTPTVSVEGWGGREMGKDHDLLSAYDDPGTVLGCLVCTE